MDYHISLRMKLKEDNWVRMGETHVVPWNTRDLIAATSGWSIMNQESAGLASELVPYLEKGIWELANRPEQYIHYEIEHGVGTIKEILKFYTDLLQDCREHPFTELYGAVEA